ncbi:MAG: undecaprenyl-diphosphate phosphatase [Brevinema sp.]
MLPLIFLAVIQGITEFLPVSSSGHLNLISFFVPLPGEHLLLYFLVLHAGTSCAAIYFFREDIFHILKGLWKFDTKTEDTCHSIKWLLLIICVSIPTALIGIPFKSSIESLGQNLLFLGIAWIVTASILLATKYISFQKDNQKNNLAEFTYQQAFFVGLAQSCALIPGISRSGVTIAMALFLGASPRFSGRLSFLASFVAIFGALLFETIDYISLGTSDVSLFPLITGFLVAFIAGLWSLKFLMSLLSHGKLYLFSFYCFGLGILSIILYFLRVA